MGKSVSQGKSFDISKWEVWEAYRRVKANKGAPGVDGQTIEAFEMSVVKSFGPTVFMNFGPGRKRLQIASGASGVAESCGLGQAVAGAAETVRGTLRVAGNGAGDSRAQRLGSGEHAAGGLAFGVDRTRASPWRLRQGPLEPLRGNVVGSFLDTLTVLPPRGAPAEQ